MKEYDVFIAGGAVAGPVAAKFCAKRGLKTLLVEKGKVPREKPCSGIQFPYFEKIIGDKIPRERLCNNELTKVEMYFPNGKVVSSKFRMLNFMRDTFDEWLCRLAEDYGAEFRDGCRFKDFEETENGTIVFLETEQGIEQIKADYIIDATGMRPVIRRKLKKELNAKEDLRGILERLNKRYFGGRLKVNKIEYVADQYKKFGCCSYKSKTIRISHHLAEMPPWVRNYVVFHEMAHIIEPNHSRAFWKIVSRYRLAERARAYLMAKGFETERESDVENNNT